MFRCPLGVRGRGCSDVPLEFVVGDVQMSPGAVCGKGCSDVPRKQFVVGDVQMSLGSCS